MKATFDRARISPVPRCGKCTQTKTPAPSGTHAPGASAWRACAVAHACARYVSSEEGDMGVGGAFFFALL